MTYGRRIQDETPTPCFYFSRCRGFAILSKRGKGVCRCCADKMITGTEYPLYRSHLTRKQ